MAMMRCVWNRQMMGILAACIIGCILTVIIMVTVEIVMCNRASQSMAEATGNVTGTTDHQTSKYYFVLTRKT